MILAQALVMLLAGRDWRSEAVPMWVESDADAASSDATGGEAVANAEVATEAKATEAKATEATEASESELSSAPAVVNPLPANVSPPPQLAWSEAQLLSLFADDETAPFSIHRIAIEGAALGAPVGSWLAPTTISQALASLVHRLAKHTPKRAAAVEDAAEDAAEATAVVMVMALVAVGAPSPPRAAAPPQVSTSCAQRPAVSH